MVMALRDVNLEIQPGEFCAFVGPSGCGKSTLLNLVAGLDLPTSGEILLDGRSTHNLTSYEWTKIRRETIGIVFQAFHLVHGLTAEENIALPLMLRGENGREITKRVGAMLECVGMSHRRRHRPAELSGGEQQMLTIGRALMTNPDLLILDEATEGLAPLIAKEIWRIIRVIRATGISTLIVDKNFAAVNAATDRNVILVKGRIVFDGSSESLRNQAEIHEKYLGV